MLTCRQQVGVAVCLSLLIGVTEGDLAKEKKASGVVSAGEAVVG